MQVEKSGVYVLSSIQKGKKPTRFCSISEVIRCNFSCIKLYIFLLVNIHLKKFLIKSAPDFEIFLSIS